jgi:dipeptidyl aminopeptidase/acylaminoacyl peptidase
LRIFYTKAPNAAARALTAGFRDIRPVLSQDGRWFYLLSNLTAPYSYDVYRVPSGGGKLQRVTGLAGVEKFALDRTGNQLLIKHSSPYISAQIAVVKADGSGRTRKLTDTRTEEYKTHAWVAPEIVKIPSTHFDGVIYAKIYRPQGTPRPNAHGHVHSWRRISAKR